MSKFVAIIDHGYGNIGSLENALNALSFPSTRFTSYSGLDIDECCGFILPGVGTFPAAMQSIKERNLDRLIYKLLSDGVKGMGICLGMQLLADWSLETGTKTEGLGLISGSVIPLQKEQATVPHIGWSKTKQISSTAISPVNLNDNFYYVHSYHFNASDPSSICGTFMHGEQVCAAAVFNQQILAVQFHPEKSQEAGLSLLKNYFASQFQ